MSAGNVEELSSSSSTSALVRRELAWEITVYLGTGYRRQIYDAIQTVLYRKGCPREWADEIYADYLLTQFYLCLVREKPLGTTGHAIYARQVARLTAYSSIRKMRQRGFIRVEDFDALQAHHELSDVRTAAKLLDLMDEFRQRMNYIRKTRLTGRQRIVAVAYKWHWIRRYGERISIKRLLPRINRALARAGYEPLNSKGVAREWRTVRQKVGAELNPLLQRIREIRHHASIK